MCRICAVAYCRPSRHGASLQVFEQEKLWRLSVGGQAVCVHRFDDSALAVLHFLLCDHLATICEVAANLGKTARSGRVQRDQDGKDRTLPVLPPQLADMQAHCGPAAEHALTAGVLSEALRRVLNRLAT
jgi:hypothetical protein